MIFNNQIRYWFKDKSKIIWLARFTKFHENSVVIIDVMLFVFLWLFKTNHHRFSSIYLCLDFWLWSSTRLSCLLRIFSSFQLQLLFFPLLHFNQKCLPSKTWKTAAAQKIGREAYPHHHITIQQSRRWALPTIYRENLSNTKQDISFQSVSYPQQFLPLSN